ncbi:hypothetical protein ES705_37717 [subsurface metagenome]
MDSVIKLIGVFILFAVSFWVLNDASARKMNAKAWAALVLLFSIIILPIYLIVRKPKMESGNHLKNGGNPKNLKSRINSKNKSMKVMSIIGIVLFSLCVLIMFSTDDIEIAAGIGFLGLLYAIALSIVGVVSSTKKIKNTNFNFVNELSVLTELKEKGLLTESEFSERKKLLLGVE